MLVPMREVEPLNVVYFSSSGTYERYVSTNSLV